MSMYLVDTAVNMQR